MGIAQHYDAMPGEAMMTVMEEINMSFLMICDLQARRSSM